MQLFNKYREGLFMGAHKEAKKESMGGVLFLMVVVLLIVSMVSTYFVLTATSTAPTMPVKQGSGEVRLTINNPALSSQAPDVNSGEVRLTVLPSG